MEQSTGHRNDEAVLREVHEIDAFWEVVLALFWCGGAWVPESNSTVPRAGDELVCIFAE